MSLALGKFFKVLDAFKYADNVNCVHFAEIVELEGLCDLLRDTLTRRRQVSTTLSMMMMLLRRRWFGTLMAA